MGFLAQRISGYNNENMIQNIEIHIFVLTYKIHSQKLVKYKIAMIRSQCNLKFKKMEHFQQEYMKLSIQSNDWRPLLWMNNSFWKCQSCTLPYVLYICPPTFITEHQIEYIQLRYALSVFTQQTKMDKWMPTCPAFLFIHAW